MNDVAPILPLVPAARPALDAYLAPTPWCDADHPVVAHLAREITRGARTQAEAVAALFAWVRDELVYTMGDWNWKASETLALRAGTCSNKANVLVAFARALGIPAGFHVQYIATPSYFRGGFVPMIQRAVRRTAIHVYVALWLDGGWVRCDPTDDRPLCEAIQAIVPHAVTLDFDGVHDALLPFAPGSVESDTGPHPDIDRQLASTPRLSYATKRMFGLYVAYMRDHGARYRVDTPAMRARIESDFRAHMSAVDPVAYDQLVAEQALAS